MNRKTVSFLFAAAVAASVRATETLLVIPANESLVNLGFDLMRMYPAGELSMVCYGGTESVSSLEYFDRYSNRWIPSDRASWDNGLIPGASKESVVLVGDSPAASSLLSSAKWANNILTPDGKSFHGVANAVHTFKPLTRRQWQSLSKIYGISLREIKVPSRYDRYSDAERKAKTREAWERRRAGSGSGEARPGVTPVSAVRQPARAPVDTSDLSLTPTEIVIAPVDEELAAARANAAAEAETAANAKYAADAAANNMTVQEAVAKEAAEKASAEAKAAAERAKAEAELASKIEEQKKLAAELADKEKAEARAAKSKAKAEAKAAEEAKAKALAEEEAVRATLRAKAEELEKKEAEAKAAEEKAKQEAAEKAKAAEEAKATAEAKAKDAAEAAAQQAKADAEAVAKAKAESDTDKTTVQDAIKKAKAELATGDAPVEAKPVTVTTVQTPAIQLPAVPAAPAVEPPAAPATPKAEATAAPAPAVPAPAVPATPAVEAPAIAPKIPDLPVTVIDVKPSK